MASRVISPAGRHTVHPNQRSRRWKAPETELEDGVHDEERNTERDIDDGDHNAAQSLSNTSRPH